MFGESGGESVKGFDEVEVELKRRIEENNAKRKGKQGQGNKEDMSRRTCHKEVNKLVMKCYLMSEPEGIEEGCTIKGYRRRMYNI